jgi:hypothetical protein
MIASSQFAKCDLAAFVQEELDEWDELAITNGFGVEFAYLIVTLVTLENGK